MLVNDERTTAAIQRYLDALQGDGSAEPLIRDLLDKAVQRLRLLCATLLRRSYPRLTQPPTNLETDELLDGVVAGLIKALQTVRPPTVRQFFALANQHMRWQLNDLARITQHCPGLRRR
jgi:RNA polymerase sigma-70 factor (ECF subfamily)